MNGPVPMIDHLFAQIDSEVGLISIGCLREAPHTVHAGLAVNDHFALEL
jgi:hypothetical protein